MVRLLLGGAPLTQAYLQEVCLLAAEKTGAESCLCGSRCMRTLMGPDVAITRTFFSRLNNSDLQSIFSVHEMRRPQPDRNPPKSVERGTTLSSRNAIAS